MVKETKGLVDMHNRVTAKQLGDLLRMQLKALEKRPEVAHVLPPLMVWGAPGLGKSTIIRDVAKEFGIGFIDVRLAQREPVDVRGLPADVFPSGIFQLEMVPFVPELKHLLPKVITFLPCFRPLYYLLLQFSDLPVDFSHRTTVV